MFTVTVLSYTGKEIKFQLKYDDVEKVSTTFKDTISIEILDLS